MSEPTVETAPKVETRERDNKAPAPAAVAEYKQSPWRAPLMFLVMGAVLVAVGQVQSWQVALGILNMSLVSALMAMGLNLQWGYAGLFNAGVMAFTALGGLAAVLVSHRPIWGALNAGGRDLVLSALVVGAVIATVAFLANALRKGKLRGFLIFLVIIAGYFLLRPIFGAAVSAVEAVDPSRTGFIGGLGLPIIVSWPIGGLLAAGVAWMIGKVALGLRSDYLAIATLGISEIVIAILKNEDWLARGVKNVTGLPRPVPYEVDLQQQQWFIDAVARFHESTLHSLADQAARDTLLRQLVIEGSSAFVKICYAGLFTVVVLILLAFCVRALNSPWGRMVRAIRDNEEAASAMGKDVTARHLQIFILGSFIIGVSGAMMTTLDGQFTPGAYNPLRFTFLIWVMVIVGGSGNNLGAVLGGFIIWFVWIEAEPLGSWIIGWATSGMDTTTPLYLHLQSISGPFRLFLMGLVLLIVMRFSPRGLLPEKVRHS